MNLRTLKLFYLRLQSNLHGIRLRGAGVEVAAPSWILGFPRVKRCPGSRIILNGGVSLFSVPYANPLGPQTRCFLHTQAAGAVIRIGEGAGISSSTIVASQSVEIGARTLIGADCLIVDNDFHSLSAEGRAQGEAPKIRPVVIGADVFIGARCIILKGSRIGDGSVIGAGSVVSGEIPAGVIAAGNPARVIKAR
jgi:acetyltransferase-like isoleucine patch superfamily enzyme